ncbi:MAG: hypothetical protein K0M58_09935 [Thiobacillus sp.]|nr:hypothetical protein [Thiobacillus sp.]
MLADARNSSFYPDWFDYIESEEAKDAFRYLVGLAAGLRNYTCYPGLHGAYRDFRFFDQHEEHPFAFGIAQKWLLFYFRLPAIRSGRYKLQNLEASFPSAKQVNSGEWTVKLRDIDDVRLLWNILQIT